MSDSHRVLYIDSESDFFDNRSKRNYKKSFNSLAMSSHRLSSEQGRPQRSLESLGSNIYSAEYIASAILNFKGSSHELRMIWEACNKHLKPKKRKPKLFISTSESDSGELGSQSSSSSDDDRSTRAPNYKNIPRSRLRKSDIADSSRCIDDSNMVNDCTNNLQKKIQNIPTNLNSTISSVTSLRTMGTIPKHLPPHITDTNITHNQSSMNQIEFYRDRFKNRFTSPSQRCDETLAAISIPETSSGHPVSIKNQKVDNVQESTSNMNPTKNLIPKSSSLLPIQIKTEHGDETVDNNNLSSQNQLMRPSFRKNKLFSQKMDSTKMINDINKTVQKNGAPAKNQEHYIKSVWDSDYDNKSKFTTASRKKIEKLVKDNKNSDAPLPVAIKTTFQGISRENNLNSSTTMKTTCDHTKKFRNAMSKLSSHRKSKPVNIGCEKVNKSTKQIKPFTNKEKSNETNTCFEVYELEIDTQPANNTPSKPKRHIKINCENLSNTTRQLKPLSSKQETTKDITSDIKLENGSQHANKKTR